MAKLAGKEEEIVKMRDKVADRISWEGEQQRIQIKLTEDFKSANARANIAEHKYEEL